MRSFRKCVPIDGSQDSDIHIHDYTVPDWQLSATSDDRPDLPSDTEDESGVDIDEEEADGSDDEQGNYITEQEAIQYARVTLGKRFCNYFCCWPQLGLSHIRQYLVYKRVSQ